MSTTFNKVYLIGGSRNGESILLNNKEIERRYITLYQPEEIKLTPCVSIPEPVNFETPVYEEYYIESIVVNNWLIYIALFDISNRDKYITALNNKLRRYRKIVIKTGLF